MQSEDPKCYRKNASRLENFVQHTKSAPRTRLALRFVGTATGEFEVFQEQVHHHQPLPKVEEIRQFCQAVESEVETADSCSRNGEVCLHGYMILVKSLSSWLKTHCLYPRSGRASSSLRLRPRVHRLRKMTGLTSNWENAREGVYMFSVAERVMSLCRYITTCWIKKIKLWPVVRFR